MVTVKSHKKWGNSKVLFFSAGRWRGQQAENTRSDKGSRFGQGRSTLAHFSNTASEKVPRLHCLRYAVMRSVNVYVPGQSIEKKPTSPQASFPPFISVDLRAKHFELWSHYWDLITFPKCSAEHLLVHCKVLQYSHNLGSQLQEN